MPSYLSLISAPGNFIAELPDSDRAMIFHGADVVVTQMNLPTLQNGGSEHQAVVPLANFVPVDSDMERAAWLSASVLAARMSILLQGATIDETPIAPAVASLFFEAMKTTEFYRSALLAVARKFKHIILVGSHQDPRLRRAICEVASSKDIELRDVLTWRRNTWVAVSPSEIYRPQARPIINAGRSGKIQLSTTTPEISCPRSDGKNAVQFWVTTGIPLQQKVARPLLEELITQKIPVLVARMPAAQDLSLPSGECIDEVAVGPFAQSDQYNNTSRMTAEFCRAQIDAHRSSFDETDAQRLEEYSGSSRFQGQVKELTGLASTLQALKKFEPRSAWVSDAIGSSTRMIVSSHARKGPIYTSFAASVSAHFRNLPLIEPDVFCLAYGSQIAEIYRERGVDPTNRVIEVGGAHYDYLYSAEATAERNKLRATLRIAARGILLVVMTARMVPEIEDGWLTAVIAWADKVNAKVLLRPHPRRPQAYDHLIGQLGTLSKTVRTSPESSEREVLSAADLVISDSSTSAIYAALLGKPLLQADFSGDTLQYNRLEEFDVAKSFHSNEELIAHLSAFVEKGARPDPAKRAAFLARFNTGGDGKAAKRAAEIVARKSVRLLAPYPLGADTLVLRTMHEGSHGPDLSK